MTLGQKHGFDRFLIKKASVVGADGDGKFFHKRTEEDPDELRMSIVASMVLPATFFCLMKIGTLFFICAALFIAGCSTPASRIAKNQAEFDAWPPAMQEKIRAGQVEIGFTQVQVQMALGNPHRKYTRIDARGTTEVWAYRDHGPTFSFGLGLGSASGSSAYGAGVGMTTGADRYDD